MKALIRITESTYEVGDIVSIVEDDFVPGTKDIKPGHRELIDIGILTDREKSLIYMQDKQFNNTSAISQISTFRHSLFKSENMKVNKRRKYKLNASNKPELKT